MDFWSCGQCWPSVGGKAGHIFGPMLSQQPGSDEGQVVALQGGNILGCLVAGLVLALPGNPGIVLSKMKPRSMAMNIELVRTTVMMESRMVMPVSIGERPASYCACIHLGNTSENKMEKPRTKRFLVQLRSTNCRL